MRDFSGFLHDEAGATVVEYALIIVATAFALIFAMPGVASRLSAVFSSVAGGWL